MNYVPVIRGELVRQQRIDELMDQLQREKERAKRYLDLIKEFARLSLFDIERLEVLIAYAQDIAAKG